jgi:hypothetical protein
VQQDEAEAAVMDIVPRQQTMELQHFRDRADCVD